MPAAFSITRVVDCRGVGSMARRGPRRGAAIGVPRCAGFGARPAGPARSPVSAGWVAGDRDPGDRGGDGLLRRARDLGGYCADRGARPTGDPVSAAEREDVPGGISTTGSGGSGPPPRRLFHRAGRGRGGRRGQVAGGRSGRQDAARGASGRSGRRASGVGVRPPHPASARAARRRREEQRNPLCAKASPPLPAGAAAGHGGRDAHPDRDREADLSTP